MKNRSIIANIVIVLATILTFPVSLFVIAAILLPRYTKFNINSQRPYLRITLLHGAALFLIILLPVAWVLTLPGNEQEGAAWALAFLYAGAIPAIFISWIVSAVITSKKRNNIETQKEEASSLDMSAPYSDQIEVFHVDGEEKEK